VPDEENNSWFASLVSASSLPFRPTPTLSRSNLFAGGGSHRLTLLDCPTCAARLRRRVQGYPKPPVLHLAAPLRFVLDPVLSSTLRFSSASIVAADNRTDPLGNQFTPHNNYQFLTSIRYPMRLRRNERCPIHRSLCCCGREPIRRERKATVIKMDVQRVDHLHHPRGYRELRSPAEMRKLLNRKIVEQDRKCAICRAFPPSKSANFAPTCTRSRCYKVCRRQDQPIQPGSRTCSSSIRR
jgi:hypothetical protein